MAVTSVYDVERALVDVLAAALLPDVANTPTFRTTLTPSVAMVDITPVPIRIFTGYPNPDEVDALANASGCFVTVNMESGMTRTVPATRRVWKTLSNVPITLNSTVVANKVTISGTATAGQSVGIDYDRTGWTVRAQDGATPATIAASFAALIPGASATGSVVTLNTIHEVTTNVVSDRVSFMALNRLAQCFRIDVYASDADSREAIAAMIPITMMQTSGLPMPVGPNTQPPTLLPVFNNDKTQIVGIWKFWQRVEVIYPMVITEVHPAVLHAGSDMNDVSIGHLYPPT